MTSLRQHINGRFRKRSPEMQTVQPEAFVVAKAPESKFKNIAKELAGVAFSGAVIISLRTLVPIVFAALPAGIAAIGLPAAMIGLTAYGVIKSSRHIHIRLKHHKLQFLRDCDISGKKALWRALKKNKFELGAFIGSLSLLGLGIVADLSSLVSSFNLDKLAETTVTETAVIGTDKLLERGGHLIGPRHAKTAFSRITSAFNAVRTRQFSDRHYQPRHAKPKPGLTLQPA